MVLAVVITFAVAPLVNRRTSDTVTVARLSEDVKQGSQIGEAQLESVKVKKDTLPSGIVTNKSDKIGKYASSPLYAGDYRQGSACGSIRNPSAFYIAFALPCGTVSCRKPSV